MSTSTEECSLTPGQSIKPCVTQEMALKIAKDQYNLNVSKVKEMASYDDKNYHIVTDDNSEYTLKILNSLDSKQTGYTEAQNEALLHLHKNGIDVPIPVTDKNGNLCSYMQFEGSSKKYSVRLLKFLPGVVMTEIPFTPKILYQWGRLLAKTQLAFKGFNNSNLTCKDRIWNMINVPQLKKFLFAVTDEGNRKLAEESTSTFEQEVLPHINEYSTGTIHGDFNELNVLSKRVGVDEFEVYGVLDLGDAHHGYYVFDLAILIAYAMIANKTTEMMDVGGYILSGFLSQTQLSEKEFDILKICIATRCAQSLILGAYTYSLDPSNKYVLNTSYTGWTVLKNLWNTPKEQLYKNWKDIINNFVP